MKTLLALLVTLVLLVTISLQPVSHSARGGALRDAIHMNRVSNTLAGLDSGSDGVGAPSFDTGHSSWFN